MADIDYAALAEQAANAWRGRTTGYSVKCKGAQANLLPGHTSCIDLGSSLVEPGVKQTPIVGSTPKDVFAEALPPMPIPIEVVEPFDVSTLKAVIADIEPEEDPDSDDDDILKPPSMARLLSHIGVGKVGGAEEDDEEPLVFGSSSVPGKPDLLSSDEESDDEVEMRVVPGRGSKYIYETEPPDWADEGDIHHQYRLAYDYGETGDEVGTEIAFYHPEKDHLVMIGTAEHKALFNTDKYPDEW